MKIVWVGLAVLAGLIVLMVVIGALLPKAHIASRSAVIAKAPVDVFALVRERAAREKEFKVVEETPPRRMVTKVIEGLPYGGTWTIDLAPEGAATRVTITENGEVYNPLFRFLSRFVFGHTATMDAYLKDLAAAAHQ